MTLQLTADDEMLDATMVAHFVGFCNWYYPCLLFGKALLKHTSCFVCVVHPLIRRAVGELLTGMPC